MNRLTSLWAVETSLPTCLKPLSSASPAAFASLEAPASLQSVDKPRNGDRILIVAFLTAEGSIPQCGMNVDFNSLITSDEQTLR
jgi:hypothetical protein